MREIDFDYKANKGKMRATIADIAAHLGHFLPDNFPVDLDEVETQAQLDIFKKWYSELAGKVEGVGSLFDSLDIIDSLSANVEEAEAARYAGENRGPE